MVAKCELTGLVDDLVDRMAEVKHAVVLSGDGLRLASDRAMKPEDADRLSAVAAGLQSLARGFGRHFRAGNVRQTVIEMDEAFLFVVAAGESGCLTVMSTSRADVGSIGFEMAQFVTRAERHLLRKAS
jgi:predicted regulator of Ras-like GTPase activity (Roadblock/LC7/MglB family)